MVDRIKSLPAAIPRDNARLVFYLVSMFVLAFTTASAFLMGGPSRPLMFLAAAVALTICLVVISSPRLALFLFVFVLFLQVPISLDLPLYLTDVCAVLVILAAVMDLLFRGNLLVRVPPLSRNFLWLLAAVFVAGLFGYDPVASIRPFLRILLIGATYVSIVTLLPSVGVSTILRLYVLSSAANSLVVLAPFVLSGGTMRSFGLSPATFGTLAMLALPIGIALFLGSERGGSRLYGASSLVILGGLIATQSRLPLMVALCFAAIVAVGSLRRARLFAVSGYDGTSFEGVHNQLKSRILAGCALTVLGVIVVLVISPHLFDTVWTRFQRILLLYTGGTIRLRLVLWRAALEAFAAHPLLGIGPGCFRNLHEIIPGAHLDPVHYYVRGLSAHNLLLHYMAETGIVGATALMALVIQLFRTSRRAIGSLAARETLWIDPVIRTLGLLFLVTTIIEAGWLWSQPGYLFALFAALIVRFRSSHPQDMRHQ